MADESVNTPSEASSVASVAADADEHKRKLEDSEANIAPEAVIESDESLKNGSQEEGNGGVDESDAKRPRLESNGDNVDEADACGDSNVPRDGHAEEKEEDEPKLLSEQAAEGRETGDYAEREPHSYTQILSCKMEVPSNKNSSTNLSSLPEDESQNRARSDSKLPSALSSKPDRPPTQLQEATWEQAGSRDLHHRRMSLHHSYGNLTEAAARPQYDSSEEGWVESLVSKQIV